MSTIRAIVVEQSGVLDVLQIKSVPRPETKMGWALVRICAFGINRSEMFTQ